MSSVGLVIKKIVFEGKKSKCYEREKKIYVSEKNKSQSEGKKCKCQKKMLKIFEVWREKNVQVWNFGCSKKNQSWFSKKKMFEFLKEEIVRIVSVPLVGLYVARHGKKMKLKLLLRKFEVGWLCAGFVPTSWASCCERNREY